MRIGGSPVTRRLLIGIIVLSVLTMVVSVAIASIQERDEVRGAIAAKSAHWLAEETSVSKLSPAEKKMRVGAFIPAVTKEHLLSSSGPAMSSSTYSATAPATLDWRNYNGNNYVTPVRDQGSCGSCWAFATTAALEANVLIVNGSSLNLSEQVLISCGGAGSCSGGYIDRASNYIMNTGLPPETYYVYTATNGSCSGATAGWQNYVQQISNWYWVDTVSPTVSTIKDWLYNYGPLVTTMDVYSDFFYYSGGVYSYTSGSYQGGHAILIVGYDDANQYFIVKNSWGSGWGESGYFRIAYSELSSLVGFGQYTIAYYTSNATPGITVTSPNGPESWQAGTAQSVQWSYTGNPGSYVKVELLKGGVLDSTISSSVSIGSGGSGAFKWTIPPSQSPGTDYQVRVTSTSNASYSDASDNSFVITAPPPPGITVSKPNGGEKWRPGSNQTITWGYVGAPGSYVKIELLKGGTVAGTISSSAKIGSSGSGSYKWRIPSSQTSGSDYAVRITSTTNSSVTDDSNGVFTISK